MGNKQNKQKRREVERRMEMEAKPDDCFCDYWERAAKEIIGYISDPDWPPYPHSHISTFAVCICNRCGKRYVDYPAIA